ncbi:related to Alpha-fucosidase A [Phialocephala subalpina]|uniref:Related to Alpha-fucosidase A n=1 Tax=Phialocephala subalpina TaxID=576137 RepID=A0A1L7XF83_9HELO|nr:related to Alpha-fucosidase A [Phialocephala subalpina]
MMLLEVLFPLFFLLPQARSKVIWSSQPALWNDIIRQAYPIGNGRLGAMPFGSPGAESVVLNIDSLWSGGPFENSEETQQKRSQNIFLAYGSGYFKMEQAVCEPPMSEAVKLTLTDVSQLLGNGDNYGSYQVYANLSVAIDGVTAADSFRRSLDFDTGLHVTSYPANDGNNYTSTVYCSYFDQVCVYHLSSSAELPKITIALDNQLVDRSLLNKTCGDQSVRLSGVTQLGPPIGMKYDGIARVHTQTGTAVCDPDSGALVIPADSHIREFTVVIGAGTNYDQTKGNAENNFSFMGEDPGAHVESVTSEAIAKMESDLRAAHGSDYQNLMEQFTLDLPDIAGSADLELSEMLDRYGQNDTSDPYLESLLFSLGRHLFISSERENSLPSNLAGRWSETLTAAWSADYHSNINFQMNHWGVDQTGLGDLQVASWNYVEDTWVPRGTETAQLLYGAPGWVVHDEMNIFGHTGMKDTAQWANYPAAAAWMMQHVYDHFSYSQNVTWFAAQGYPLLKGIAEFWLSQLQPDTYYNDGTLVVNPCNSPEHGPTTFACTHYQQLIHQLFTNILSSTASIPNLEPDTTFITNLTNSLTQLDKGLHIGTFNEIKEWKIPDSLGYDFPNDTHRHLSHLIGWYPGYSISSFLHGYTNTTIQSSIRTSLLNRGNGTGPDADAGWEKVWRSACWAMLNDTDMAYGELRYAIQRNLAANGLSMYWAKNPPFQIDANFGLVGAVLAMLVVDLPGTEAVVLGPAIPKEWGGGSVKGLGLRGGGKVDFEWDESGVVKSAKVAGTKTGLRVVNVEGQVLIDV